MRVDVALDCPASKESALLGDGERLSVEPVAVDGGHVAGRVDEHDLVLARPSEELARCSEAAGLVGGLESKECFDVGDVDKRPVVLRSLCCEEPGEVSNEGDRRFDGRVGAREGAGTTCPFPRADQMLSEQRNRWAQRGGCRVDATLASCEGESGVLVEAEREAPLDKELLELCGPTLRANGPSGGSVPGVRGDGRPGRRAGDARRR